MEKAYHDPKDAIWTAGVFEMHMKMSLLLIEYAKTNVHICKIATRCWN